jgi:putative holliday junction resolvase
MRIMALDPGTKRVGVALSDETTTIAQPLEFIPAEPLAACLDRLKVIAQERQVCRIVIGLPRNMNGTYGPAAESARQFAAEVEKAVGLPIKMWDERLTSTQANRMLIQAGMSREKRKTKVDQSAAAILLQSYLDSLPPTAP